MDKRLLSLARGHARWLAANVACQWAAMLANVGAVLSLCWVAGRLSSGLAVGWRELGLAAAAFGLALAARFACSVLASMAAERVCAGVKEDLRERVMAKLLELGPSYTAQGFSTSEVVQVASEGVDQLEAFFGRYLPQLFYAVLAPLTLFSVLAPVDLPSAAVLLVCVPLIPVCIALVQTIAGRLFKRYWGSYTELGDIFLEDVQGMTTLKINQADGFYQRKMNEAAERFRVATMNVLRMQLNSIIVMDLVAYGGAAVGMVVAASRLASGAVGFAGALAVVLLAAEFFIPMRTLGSYFHVAMNGMAASKKLFAILDAPAPEQGSAHLPEGPLEVEFRGVTFAYPGAEKPVLDGLDLAARPGGMTGLVGLSGSGKSTAAGLLAQRLRGYGGHILVGGVELSEVPASELLARVTLVDSDSYLFAGTVADNLRMADPAATPERMRAALEAASVWGFFEAAQGLDTRIEERASNLSGGQRQRLALARALLHGGDVFVFDEATSNIDAESEAAVMETVARLARERTVVVISHRLANVAPARDIVLLEGGRVAEEGTHEELVALGGSYARIYAEQRELESYGEARR